MAAEKQTILVVDDTPEHIDVLVGTLKGEYQVKAAEFKDNETGLHVIRMSKYSHLLAGAAGFSEADAELLMNAASMHDIGKIGIPDHILRKPGRLTGEEFGTMQTHCQIGADVIDYDDSELLQLAAEIALVHHEKWNGTGYPNGLGGKDISLPVRIVTLADVFDALTSERPYKKAWPIEEAVELLESEAGIHFDPDLVPLFVELLPEVISVKESYSEEVA